MNNYKEAMSQIAKICEQVEENNALEKAMKEFKKNAQEMFLAVFAELSKYLETAKTGIGEYYEALEAQKALYRFIVEEFENR